MNSKQINETFREVEATVFEQSDIPPERREEAFEPYKVAPVERVTSTDPDLYRLLVEVVFYSGFSAYKVQSRMATIQSHLGDPVVAEQLTGTDVARIVADPKMLGNRRKIVACITNAKTFLALSRQHGSFAGWLNSFGSLGQLPHAQELMRALIRKFAFISNITVYHFLMELGVQVVKPDRVLQRVFFRLGWTADPSLPRTASQRRTYLWSVVSAARAIADSTGLNIRYIDIVFMAFGQLEVKALGVRGVCLEDDPRCGACHVTTCAVRRASAPLHRPALRGDV